MGILGKHSMGLLDVTPLPSSVDQFFIKWVKIVDHTEFHDVFAGQIHTCSRPQLACAIMYSCSL